MPSSGDGSWAHSLDRWQQLPLAVALWLVLPGGKHEARGLIDLRDRTLELSSRNNEDYENYRKNQIFILKTRDLLNRTVNDPAVSSLEMIRNTEDPVRLVEEGITVTAPCSLYPRGDNERQPTWTT